MKRLNGTALLLGALLPMWSTVARAQVAEFDGRPAFSVGADLGYYLWKEGDTWRVRWTTKGVMRHFAGSVTADRGELKSLKRVDVESERRVLYPGRPAHVGVGPRGHLRMKGGRAPVVVSRDQDKVEKDGNNRIVFSARTDDDIDGFDLVEFGPHNRKATSIPLIVRLR